MALITLASAGGAPGATTAGLALAVAWPREVLLASCDPAGCGLRAGYLAAAARDGLGDGVMGWLAAARRNPEPADGELLWPHLLVTDADDTSRYVLPGLSNPGQASALMPWWPALAQAFNGWGTDVVADVGRVGDAATPAALLQRADLVVLVLRPTLRQVYAARARMADLCQVVGGSERIGVVVVAPSGESARASEVATALGVTRLGELAYDADQAAALSEGTALSPRRLRRGALLRSAADLARRLADHQPRTPTTGAGASAAPAPRGHARKETR